uniref:Transmembrane protein 182 n=1 Tax=Panagrellus redivivus TaxID=6233 RepID=A0A7E4W975_PANRE
MVNLEQNLSLIDYLAAPVVGAIFMVILILITCTVLNFCCVLKDDDITVVEKWGHKHHIHGVKLGVHRPSYIERSVAANKYSNKLQA